MTIAHRQAVSLDHGIEVMPAGIGVQAPRQLDGAKHFGIEGPPEPAELAFEKAIIETSVVGDEDAACDAFLYFIGDALEGWRVGDHRIGDPGHGLYRSRDAAFRIDQRAPLLHAGAVVDAHDADFGDAIVGRAHACGFEVHKGKGGCKHRAWA